MASFHCGMHLIIFQSCIVSLLGQHQYCDTAYECVGTDWVLADGQLIYGNGYKSLYGQSTTITDSYQFNYVFCYGAFACSEIAFIDSQYRVSCSGSYSCANINGSSYIQGSYVSCYAANSCPSSNIKASDSVGCLGSESCVSTKITSPKVYAHGLHSLYNLL
eukprot:213200_1